MKTICRYHLIKQWYDLLYRRYNIWYRDTIMWYLVHVVNTTYAMSRESMTPALGVTSQTSAHESPTSSSDVTSERRNTPLDVEVTSYADVVVTSQGGDDVEYTSSRSGVGRNIIMLPEPNDFVFEDDESFGYVHPAVLTIVIAVVIIVVIVIVVRATLCIRKRSGCRSGADRVQPASAGVQETEDVYSEIGVYQQPPEYQECVNNPAYRKPVRDEYCAKAEECTARDVRPPPSYDKVEEGEYETLTVPEKHAMERLKREIMNRFRCSSPSPEVSCATAVDGAGQLEQAEFSGQAVRDHRAQHGARPADGRGARKLGKDNRGFEAPMGDCPGPLTRTASNLSRSSSIPKYNDLVHPPTYDNLSFCADRRDDVVNLPSDVTSEANISRDERIAIPEAQARERGDVVTDIRSDASCASSSPPVTIAEETTTNELNPEDPEYRESEFHPRSVAERVLVETSLNGQQRYILAKVHSCGDLPTTTNPDVSSRDSSESANPEPQWRHLVTTSDEQQVPLARSGSEAHLSPGCKQFSCQGRIRSMPCLDPGSCGRCAPNELVLDACSLGHRDRGTLNERCSNSRLSILPSSDSVV